MVPFVLQYFMKLNLGLYFNFDFGTLGSGRVNHLQSMSSALIPSSSKDSFIVFENHHSALSTKC